MGQIFPFCFYFVLFFFVLYFSSFFSLSSFLFILSFHSFVFYFLFHSFPFFFLHFLKYFFIFLFPFLYFFQFSILSLYLFINLFLPLFPILSLCLVFLPSHFVLRTCTMLDNSKKQIRVTPSLLLFDLGITIQMAHGKDNLGLIINNVITTWLILHLDGIQSVWNLEALWWNLGIVLLLKLMYQVHCTLYCV